ncbi:MAG: hypothetical protein IPN49_07830 [Saprospiraceae bacterium]|nr:hypothetical protein [Saprospiraceae bacterium]
MSALNGIFLDKFIFISFLVFYFISVSFLTENKYFISGILAIYFVFTYGKNINKREESGFYRFIIFNSR